MNQGVETWLKTIIWNTKENKDIIKLLMPSEHKKVMHTETNLHSGC